MHGAREQVTVDTGGIHECAVDVEHDQMHWFDRPIRL